MHHQRTCPRCEKAGFIRAERVIKATTSVTAFFCGACELRWEERDSTAAARGAHASSKRA
jgi:transcription elongation factor Elf1